MLFRSARPTLWQVFVAYLSREGYASLAVASAKAGDVNAIQETLIRIYRTDPKNSEICERFVDLDEGLQEWRYRHVKMVERTIGAKTGTGGSAGAEYLRTTLMKPVFPDLWEIRSRL